MALIDRFSGDLDERRMSLGEHLEELRKHVWKSVIWVSVALAGCLFFQSHLMRAARYPFDQCMDELKKDRQTAYWNARTSHPGLVGQSYEELMEREKLEATARRLETNAAILKEKVSQNPKAVVDALAKRRGELQRREQEIEDEQTRLMGSPDPLKVADLEKKRLALAEDVKVYSEEMQRDIAPLIVGVEANIPQARLTALTFPETFMSYLKVAMVCAIFVASPLVARELWKFVSAGLYKNEKKYVTFFAPLTFVVFIIGCCFGYFVLIPAGLKFLANYGGDEIGTEFRLSDYLSLLLNLTLMVGLIFELPLVMGFLSLLGFTDAPFYRRLRRYWLLAAFVLGAIIAPSPDPFNQSLCAVPLLGLYEIGILLSAWLTKKREAELGMTSGPPAGAVLAPAGAPISIPSAPPPPATSTGAPSPK